MQDRCSNEVIIWMVGHVSFGVWLIHKEVNGWDIYISADGRGRHVTHSFLPGADRRKLRLMSSWLIPLHFLHPLFLLLLLPLWRLPFGF
jgi:hypothetical protein